jgi:hypothetical protein
VLAYVKSLFALNTKESNTQALNAVVNFSRVGMSSVIMMKVLIDITGRTLMMEHTGLIPKILDILNSDDFELQLQACTTLSHIYQNSKQIFSEFSSSFLNMDRFKGISAHYGRNGEFVEVHGSSQQQ